MIWRVVALSFLLVRSQDHRFFHFQFGVVVVVEGITLWRVGYGVSFIYLQKVTIACYHFIFAAWVDDQFYSSEI